MSDKISDLLIERGTTHGEFLDVARMAQGLKADFRCGKSWDAMAMPHQEALDMIATKLARIASGDPKCAGHWEDIEGYARLAREWLNND